MEPETDRIRIVRLIARMNVGGPAQIICALQRGLDAQFDQTLLVGEVDSGEADWLELRAPDVVATKVAGLGRSVRLLGDARAFVTLVRFLRRTRPDIVETHTAKAGVLGRLAAMVAAVPIRVHVFHGHLLYGYFPPWKTTLVSRTEALLARRTTRLLAVGEKVRDELLAAGVGRHEQYLVVTPGVSPPGATAPRDETRAGLGVLDDRPVVLFVGRLTEIKRADRFVRIAHALHERGRAVAMVIVGDGPLRPRLEELAAELGAPVTFAGWRSDMDSVYAAADLIVLASDNEGVPVALIEAAAHGLPAVATDVGAVGQIVRDGRTGVLVPVDRLDLMVRAVDELVLDEPRRRRLGAAARDLAAAQMDERLLIEQFARLYRDLGAR